MSRAKPELEKTCAEPGCTDRGMVRVVGNSALYCFKHKPVGKIK